MLYIVFLICNLFPSLVPQQDRILVAQFNLYMNHEREIFLEVTIDRNAYGNDCQAFYDLCQYKKDICSQAELIQIQEFLGDTAVIPKPILKTK
jgi:hypothetical protein